MVHPASPTNSLDTARAALSETGHELLTACSAAEARQPLKTMAPDLAVVDVMMEDGFPGFDLAIEIHDQAPDVPVLMVSSIKERLKAPVPFGRDENLPIHRATVRPFGAPILPRCFLETDRPARPAAPCPPAIRSDGRASNAQVGSTAT